MFDPSFIVLSLCIVAAAFVLRPRTVTEPFPQATEPVPATSESEPVDVTSFLSAPLEAIDKRLDRLEEAEGLRDARVAAILEEINDAWARAETKRKSAAAAASKMNGVHEEAPMTPADAKQQLRNQARSMGVL